MITTEMGLVKSINTLHGSKAIIQEELEAKGIELSREGSNGLTKTLLELKAN